MASGNGKRETGLRVWGEIATYVHKGMHIYFHALYILLAYFTCMYCTLHTWSLGTVDSPRLVTRQLGSDYVKIVFERALLEWVMCNVL